jgi:pimeloyl-ACP methyl ester carboxylesterase
VVPIARSAGGYLAALRLYLLDEEGMRARLAASAPHDPRDCRVACSGHAPVVLVHGFLGRKSNFLPTIELLREHGFHHVRAAGYDVVNHSVEDAARRIHDKVARVAEQHGVERVNLIAHSMGGVAALHAATRLGTDAHLSAVVTLGAPYGGTLMAEFAPSSLQIGRTARQLSISSPLLAELRSEIRGLEVPWMSLWSPRDRIVAGWSAQPVGLTARRLPPVGHVEMLFHREVAAEAVAALESLQRTSEG